MVGLTFNLDLQLLLAIHSQTYFRLLKIFLDTYEIERALKRRTEMKKILLILVFFIILGGCVSSGQPRQSGEAPRSHSRSDSGCTTNWCGSSWGM